MAVPQDPKHHSINDLAKHGRFEALCNRIDGGEDADLATIFERAVTDFRTVKRNAGHNKILQWCLDKGLALDARAGWMNQSVVCLAAANGNNEIISSMMRKGLPDNPFARASVGDLEFLANYALRQELQDLQDENGFNLLFYCAQSGLGRRDERLRDRLADTCRLLIDHGVSPSHEVQIALPIFPAFLCASSGGNREVMRLLLDHGGLTAQRFHLVLEHALEPHQRSGDPFYHIAELVLQYRFNINESRPDQGRTALHAASTRGSVKATRWLLQNGADPNALDAQGRTPLHVCAARNNVATVVKLLIGAGSEPNALDASGNTPLDCARKNGRSKVADYLVSVIERAPGRGQT